MTQITKSRDRFFAKKQKSPGPFQASDPDRGRTLMPAPPGRPRWQRLKQPERQQQYPTSRPSSMGFPWKSKTKQRMVFRMIHEFRIPDPTNGKKIGFWTSWLSIAGGWTNPSEKYACEIGSSSQVGF